MGYRLLVKRSDWASTMADMESLTADRLRAAATAMSNGHSIEDPVIFKLLRKLTAIGNPVPQSFAEKKKMRSHTTGITVRNGVICYWVTINNPSDLRNPVILRLGGVNFGSDDLPEATAAVIRAAATSNPVAVAQFFHNTCCALFDGLLGSNHYGVVEANGRGMLNLHVLLWAKGNVDFANIRIQESHLKRQCFRCKDGCLFRIYHHTKHR